MEICPKVVSFGEVLNVNSIGDAGLVLGVYLNAVEVLGKNVTSGKAVLLLDKERRQEDRFREEVSLDLSGDKGEGERKRFRLNNDDGVSDDRKFDAEDNEVSKGADKEEKVERGRLRQKEVQKKFDVAQNEIKRGNPDAEPEVAIYEKPVEKGETHDDSKIKEISLEKPEATEEEQAEQGKVGKRLLHHGGKLIEERILQAITAGDSGRRLYQDVDMNNLTEEQRIANKLARENWKLDDFSKYKGIFDVKSGPKFADQVYGRRQNKVRAATDEEKETSGETVTADKTDEKEDDPKNSRLTKSEEKVLKQEEETEATEGTEHSAEPTKKDADSKKDDANAKKRNLPDAKVTKDDSKEKTDDFDESDTDGLVVRNLVDSDEEKTEKTDKQKKDDKKKAKEEDDKEKKEKKEKATESDSEGETKKKETKEAEKDGEATTTRKDDDAGDDDDRVLGGKKLGEDNSWADLEDQSEELDLGN